jgi:hypothetical protein
VRLPVSAVPGSVFSLGNRLENQPIDRQIRHGSLEPVVLNFKCLELFGLVDLHPAIGLAPAVVGLLGDTQLPAGLCNGPILP